MPLPTPAKTENKDDFISRCISTLSDKTEFKDQKQRIAVCYTRWEKAKNGNASKS